MAAKSLPDKIVQEIRRLRQEEKLSCREIGARLGIHHSSAARYLKQAGEEVQVSLKQSAKAIELQAENPCTEEEMMAVFDLDPKRWIPTRFNIGVSRYGPRGSMSLKRVISEELENKILEFVREHVKPLPKPKLPRSCLTQKPGEFLVVLGMWDLHLGAYAWNTEVGDNWDVEIACHRAMNAIDDVVKELVGYKVDKIIMPMGGDFLHYDSNRMKTVSGEHHLDCDTRFARVYQAGLRLLAYFIERAADLCTDVEYIYIPGNHDASVAFTLCSALNERYRNDPRIHIDLGPNPRKYRSYGKTLLGFDHGKIPINQLKMIFAEEACELWSNSRYREFQIGHTHQRRAQEFPGVLPLNGMTVRTNPTLCSHDFWHHNKGLIGEAMRSIEAWRYSKVGYRGSHVAWARDDQHPDAVKLIAEIE